MRLPGSRSASDSTRPADRSPWLARASSSTIGGVATAPRSDIVSVPGRIEMVRNEQARKIDGHCEPEEIDVVGFSLARIR